MRNLLTNKLVSYNNEKCPNHFDQKFKINKDVLYELKYKNNRISEITNLIFYTNILIQNAVSDFTSFCNIKKNLECTLTNII